MAALYDLQSRRLANVADRVRLIVIGRDSMRSRRKGARAQVQLEQNLNDSTMHKVEGGIPPDDTHGSEITREAIEAYNPSAVSRHLVIRKAAD